MEDFVTLNQAKNVVGIIVEEAKLPQHVLIKCHELLSLYANKNQIEKKKITKEKQLCFQ